MLICGWDISTSAIGVCVCDRDGTFMEHDLILPKGETHHEKHRDAATRVQQWLAAFGIKECVHVVEQHLGGFSGGFSSAQTKMALASMNAVISYVLGLHSKVIHILPVTTKAIMRLVKQDGEDKKDAVVRMFRAAVPSFPYRETKAGNWVKGTDDIADAWLLASAGGRIIRGEASLPSGRKKKTASDKPKARRAKGKREAEG
jgi:hypothetical protein